MINDNIIYLILICLNIISFMLGYLFGKLKSFNGVVYDKPKSFFQRQKEQPAQTVAIDSSTIVTNISTGGLEKKYNDFGTSKESTEDISSSINKLKNMKG